MDGLECWGGGEGHIVGVAWSWTSKIFRLFLSIFLLLCGTGSADPELDMTARTYSWWVGWKRVGGAYSWSSMVVDLEDFQIISEHFPAFVWYRFC